MTLTLFRVLSFEVMEGCFVGVFCGGVLWGCFAGCFGAAKKGVWGLLGGRGGGGGGVLRCGVRSRVMMAMSLSLQINTHEPPYLSLHPLGSP